jgi:MFS family permease
VVRVDVAPPTAAAHVHANGTAAHSQGAALSRRAAFLLILSLLWVFFSTGLVVSILGPTLDALASQLHAPLAAAVLTLTCRSVGFFIGGIAGPAILDAPALGRDLPRLAIAVPVALELCATLCIPSCAVPIALYAVALVQGFGVGCAENMAKLVSARAHCRLALLFSPW